MAKRYKRVKIMQVSEIEQLEDIIPLLQLDYTKGIKYLTNYQLSFSEKNLLNRWICLQDNFNIEEEVINEEQIRYIMCSAYIEMAAPEKDAIINDSILPKEHRVKRYEHNCIFFEVGHRIYILTMCSSSMDARLRSNLMGAGRGYEQLAEVWGVVEDRDIPEYNYSSDFFYWLTSKEGQRIELGEQSITIDNIKCLNNSNDRGDINYSSEGNNLLDETIPRTTIGTNTNMELVGITVNMENGTFDIRIQNDGTCFISESNTCMYNEDGTIRLFQEDSKSFILIVYNFILPLLRQCYHSDIVGEVWGIAQQTEYRKRRALEVIKDLYEENNISFEEIDTFLNE